MEAHNCRIPSQAASVVEGSRGISYSAHGGRCGADCGRWGPRGRCPDHGEPSKIGALLRITTLPTGSRELQLDVGRPTGWQCSCKTLWLWSWSFVKRTLRTTHIQVSNIQTASLHIVVLYFSSVHNFDPFGKPTSGTTNKVWARTNTAALHASAQAAYFCHSGWSNSGWPNSMEFPSGVRGQIRSTICTANLLAERLWGQLRGISISFLSTKCITWIQNQFL